MRIMNDLADLFDQLPAPEHHPSFWTNLEAALAETAPADITTTRNEPHLIEVDLSGLDDRSRTPLPDPLRRTLIVAAGIAAAIAALVFGINIIAEDTGPVPVVTDAHTTTIAPPPIVTDGTSTEDGAPLFGLPLEVSQRTDLADGSSIMVTGSERTPGTQIAVIQCHGPTDPVSPAIDNCDLSNFEVLYADESGEFVVEFTARRFITNGKGSVDCADPPPESRCAVSAADTADITNVAILEITFEPESSGTKPPTIGASKTEGLAHDELVTVEGRDFIPGEIVYLSSCPPGVDGFDSCFELRGAYKVVAGADGAFSREIRVSQLTDSLLCANAFFSCYIAAGATRPPNPIEITFAEDAGGSAPTLTPTGPFMDGEVVRFRLPLAGASPGEEFTVQQCRTPGTNDAIMFLTGAAQLDGDVCGRETTGIMGPTGALFELAVAADLDSTDKGAILDCAIPDSSGYSTCEIRVETASYRFPRSPIYFDPTAGTPLSSAPAD